MFTLILDPVGAGYVDSLAHPGGNATGFTVFEYAIGGKWLEQLKEIAPRVTQVAVLREAAVAAGPAQFGAAQTVAPSLGMETATIAPTMAVLAASSYGGETSTTVVGTPRTNSLRCGEHENRIDVARPPILAASFLANC